MLLRFCVFMFLLSQVQITASSFETNKISLFSSQSSQKQKGQSLQQGDKATDTDLSLVQIITEISKITKDTNKTTITIDQTSSTGFSNLECSLKKIEQQNEDILKTLDAIHNDIKIVKHQTACCTIS